MERYIPLRIVRSRNANGAESVQARVYGELPEPLPTACAPGTDPAACSDKRGYYLPHLSIMKPKLDFSANFWTMQQFFTRGTTAAEHIMQLKVIPDDTFSKIEVLCLDYGFIHTVKVDREKRDDAFLRDIQEVCCHCFARGSTELLIKVTCRTTLPQPGSIDEEDMHCMCDDRDLCWDGKCEFGGEPAEQFIEFCHKFEQQFRGRRAIFVPLVTWINWDATSIEFHDITRMCEVWNVHERLHQDATVVERPDADLAPYVQMTAIVSSLLRPSVRSKPSHSIRSISLFDRLYGDQKKLEIIMSDFAILELGLTILHKI